jgi:uncharacterized membrane protein
MNRRLIAIAALAASGVAISFYLLTIHWGWWQAVCFLEGSKCEAVNLSRYSELLGIPVALLGALAYLAIIAASVMIARKMYVDQARIGLFFIAAIGVAFSAYLTSIEAFVLHQYCEWCVLSAILVTAIAILSALELRQT